MWSDPKLENQPRGFTLIEVILYLALFAMIFGGIIVSAYNVIEGSGRTQSRAQMQEEGEFLLGKITWVLSGAQTINSPSIGDESSILSVTKYNGATLQVKLDDANLELNNAGTSTVLNASGISIVPGSLKFKHQMDSGIGINPESVESEFTLTAKTPNGQDITQDFSSTTYLRK